MKSFIRSIALAGLMSAGFAGGSAMAQQAAVPSIAALQASVTAACAGVTSLEVASPECRAALVLLLAYYGNDATVLAFVAGFIGDAGIEALAEEVAAQRELLGIETGAILPDDVGAPPSLGDPGVTPVTPS